MATASPIAADDPFIEVSRPLATPCCSTCARCATPPMFWSRSSRPPLQDRPLPDSDPSIGRDIHRVRRLDVEGRVPVVDVAHDPDHPIVRGRMGVGNDQLALEVVADLLPPDLREAQEEAL